MTSRVACDFRDLFVREGNIYPSVPGSHDKGEVAEGDAGFSKRLFNHASGQPAVLRSRRADHGGDHGLACQDDRLRHCRADIKPCKVISHVCDLSPKKAPARRPSNAVDRENVFLYVVDCAGRPVRAKLFFDAVQYEGWLVELARRYLRAVHHAADEARELVFRRSAGQDGPGDRPERGSLINIISPSAHRNQFRRGGHYCLYDPLVAVGRYIEVRERVRPDAGHPLSARTPRPA